MAEGFTPTPEDVQELRNRLSAKEERKASLTDQRNVILETDSPDDAAYDLKKSQELGIPREAIGGARDEYKAEDTLAKMQKMRTETPTFGEWISEPENYAVARDEADDLSVMERLVRTYDDLTKTDKVARAFGSFGPAMEASFAGLAASSIEAPGLTPFDAAIMSNLDKVRTPDLPEVRTPDMDFSGFRNPFAKAKVRVPEALDPQRIRDRASRNALAAALSANQRLEAARPVGATEESQAVLSGIGSMTEMAPAMVAGIIARRPDVPMAIMSRQVYGQSYARGRAEGLDPGGAVLYAGAQSGIERVTERLGLEILFGKNFIGKNLGKRLLASLATEQVQEQFATLGQDFVDWQVLNPEKTAAEFIEERGPAAYQTAIATLVASAPTNTAVLTVEAIGNELEARARASQASPGDKLINDVLDKAAGSKLATRNPEKLADLLGRLTEGTAAETVTVDLDGVVEALEQRGIDPTETLSALGLTQDQLAQKWEQFGEAEISLATLAASPAMREHRDAIQPHLRTQGEDFTPAKKEKVREGLQEDIAREAEAIRGALEDGKALETQQEAVAERVRERIRGAGILAERAQEDASVAVQTAMVTTLARRLGVDAVEFFDQHYPRIQGNIDGMVSEADVLEQAREQGYEGDDTGEAASWRAAVAKGLDMSQAGRMARAKEMGFDTDTVLYHGSSKDFDAFREGDRGIFFGAKETASDYGEAKAYYVRGKMAPRSVVVQVKKEIKADRAKSVFSRFENERPHQQRELVKRLKALGYDGYSQGMGIPGALGETVIFDPSNIRSVNAAFDPDNAGSADLLAQEAGAQGLDLTPEALSDPDVQDAVTDPETDILELTGDMEVLQLDEFIAFHGTLARFDKFEMAKLGSGEGAQAFGPGHYFTQSAGVAEWYRKRMKRLSPGLKMGKEDFNKANPAHFALAEYWSFRNKELHHELFGGYKSAVSDRTHAGALEDAIRSMGFMLKEAQTPWKTPFNERILRDPTAKNAAMRDRQEIARFLEAGIEHLKSINPKSTKGVPRPSKPMLRGGGNIYTVAVKLPPDATIQYDLPLGQQPAKVQEAFRIAAERGFLGKGAEALAQYGDETRMDVLVSSLKGANTEAMQVMREAGIRGIRYLDGMSRGKKNPANQSYNYVAFNDEDVKILSRDSKLFQEFDQQRRGQFSPSQNIITMFEAADVTTLMHEGAHWYLAEIERMATAEGAHPFVVEQWEAVKKWGKVGPDFRMYDDMGRITEEGRELQEAFAETFEVYLQTGKAPTDSLREAFRAFKAWITSLWRDIRTGKIRLPKRANLNPEIVRVMDRMLAVDEEIDAQTAGTMTRAEQHAKELLDRGILTQKQYEKALRDLDAAREAAKEDLMAQVMEAQMRVRAAQLGTEERRIKGDVTREYDRSLAGRALSWLGYGQWKGDVPANESPGDEREFYQNRGQIVSEAQAVAAREFDDELARTINDSEFRYEMLDAELEKITAEVQARMDALEDRDTVQIAEDARAAFYDPRAEALDPDSPTYDADLEALEEEADRIEQQAFERARDEVAEESVRLQDELDALTDRETQRLEGDAEAQIEAFRKQAVTELVDRFEATYGAAALLNTSYPDYMEFDQRDRLVLGVDGVPRSISDILNDDSFGQSLRTATTMPMQEVTSWVLQHTEPSIQQINDDEVVVLNFTLDDTPDGAPVRMSIRLQPSGRADVNLFLDGKLADSLSGVTDRMERARAARDLFSRAIMALRQYAAETPDLKAIHFVAAESRNKGTKEKSREDLYRFMLSTFRMEGYTAYEIEQQMGLVREEDGVKSSEPRIGFNGFVLIRDGVDPNEFARNEILRGTQTGGDVGEIVTAFRATQLGSPARRAADGRGPGTRGPAGRGAVEDTLGQEAPPKYKPVEDTASADGSFEFARNQLFATNRDLKVGMQDRVKRAADRNDADLLDEDYLVRMTERDARSALVGNANAVGWYDEKVRKAITALTLLHPELETDAEARFAFTWALAVTSNGLKVDKNFELAETVYSGWKASSEAGGPRRMPTNVGIGTASKAINKSLGLYNTLVEKHGVQVVLEFMTTRQTVKQVQAFTGENVSGENLTTEVFGAAALGPKIGNGFFMNLYGEFGQLTMDRWLMRTWGRWSATLITDYSSQARESRKKLGALLKLLSPTDKRALEKIIRRPIKLREIDEVGLALQRASQKPALREEMNKLGLFDDATEAAVNDILGPPTKGADRNAVGAEIRKRGNALAKYLDGQKEQPSGPPERAKIRAVFARALENMKKDYPALTMADLQALLWYPEKRLYDTAKSKEDQESEGYEDDEAPDYANAARNLVVSKGVAEASVRDAYARIDADVQAARRAGRVEREGAGRSGRGGTQGFADGARQDDTLGQSVAPTFYSALGRFVSQSGTARAPAAQWKGMISNAPGVKAEEVEWSGVMDWLDAQDGPVTREALAAFVAANGVRVEEVVRGGVGVAAEAQQRMLPLIEERDRVSREFGRADKSELDALAARLDELSHEIRNLQRTIDLVDDDVMNDTKWSSWTLPGGENYREMLLTLPTEIKAKQNWRVRRGDNMSAGLFSTEAEAQAWIDNNGTTPGFLRIEREPDSQIETGYRSSHWREMNVLAHVRFKERIGPNGERVLALEEVQSDWHQAGRERGYKGTEPKVTEEMVAAQVLPEGTTVKDSGSAPEFKWVVRFPDNVDGNSFFYGATREAAEYQARRWLAGDRTQWAGQSNAVPNAPFKNNAWANLVLKRMIRYAAENGFDALAWIPGNVQNGQIVEDTGDNRGDFYDKIVPNLANKLGKKYGAKTGKIALDMPAQSRGTGWEDTGQPRQAMNAQAFEFWTLPLTPELAAAAMEEGFPLFQRGDPKGWGETAPPPELPPMRLDLEAVRQIYGEDAVRRLPRAIRDRSRDQTSIDGMLAIIRANAKTLKRKPPKTLFQFIRSRKARTVAGKTVPVKKWGIRGAADELKAMNREDLINEENGIHIDDVRESAAEAGYLEDGATINDFLNAIDKEARGEPVYSRFDQKEVEDLENAKEWADWLDSQGVDIFETDQKKLKAEVAKIVTSTNADAVTPDQAAEMLGFPTGEDLLNVLALMGNREKWIREETDRRLREEMGDPMADGTFAEEARIAAEAEVNLRAAEIEIEALARAVGEPAASKLAKDMAMESLGMMTVKELGQWERFLTAERREMRNTLEAVRRGDMVQAFIHKRRQMVNMHLAKAAREKSEAIEKQRKDLLTYYTSKGRRDKIARDYLEKIEAILEGYELRVSKQGPGEQKRRLSAKEYVDQMTADGREAEIAPEALLLAEMAGDKVWRNLFADEVDYLVGTVRNLAHLGRTKGRLMREQDKRRFDAVVADLVDTLMAAPSARDRGRSFTPTTPEKITSTLRQFDARLTRLEFQFSALDGKENGPIWNTLFRPFAEAADVETRMMREAAQKMKGLYEAFDTGERMALFHRRVPTPELATPGKADMTVMDIVVLGLNWGNAGNRKAIMDGYGWDGAAVEAVLNRVLTDKHWDFIEGTWDLIGSYRADAFALEKAITGVEPKAVEGIDFTLASGRAIKGKYYPLKYDGGQARADSVVISRLDEKQALSDLGKTFSKPMTKTGHLIERVGSGGKPVKINIGVMHEHVQNVIHDIAYRKAVIDAHRLIRDPRFADAYIQASGRDQYDQLLPWLAAIATERNGDPGGIVTKLFQGLRRNMTVVAMGYKIGTAIQQLTGPLQGMTMIGPRYMAQGFVKTAAGGPASFWSAWKNIAAKSEFMRDRPQGFDRDIRMVTNRLQERTPLGSIQRNSMILTAMVDMFSSVVVWQGAYDRALDGNVEGVQKGNEEDAIAWADSVVRQTQVAGRTQDLPQIMRGTETEKLVTMMFSYFSGLYNFSRKQKAFLQGGRIGLAEFNANLIILYVAVPLMAGLLAGRLLPDEDDEPEDIAMMAGKEIASNAAGTIPIFRDLVNATLNPQFGYQMSPVGSGVNRLTGAAARAATGDTLESEAAVKEAVNALGILFGLPSGQLVITGDYVYDLVMGEEDPTEDPVDAAREALVRNTR